MLEKIKSLLEWKKCVARRERAIQRHAILSEKINQNNCFGAQNLIDRVQYLRLRDLAGKRVGKGPLMMTSPLISMSQDTSCSPKMYRAPKEKQVP